MSDQVTNPVHKAAERELSPGMERRRDSLATQERDKAQRELRASLDREKAEREEKNAYRQRLTQAEDTLRAIQSNPKSAGRKIKEYFGR